MYLFSSFVSNTVGF